MSRRVVFIQGGGVGLDQEAALLRLLSTAGVHLEWQRFEAGEAALTAGQDPLPPPMLEAIRTHGVALKTKLLNPPDGRYPNFNVELRRRLGLFASVRPIRNVRGLPSRYTELDFVLIREITEDLYTAVEHEIVPGVVQSLKIVTEAACRRFFRFAFEYARAQGRETIHCIHKANILKLADGLFLECFRQTARDFPDIQPKDLIVDNCCMQLLSRPKQFDILVAGNLYGDLLSDLGAGLVGGISATLGINHGEGVRVYEAIHGRSREGLGPNRANPLPLLLPALEMLRDLGHRSAAERIQRATEAVLPEGRFRTFDLGGTASTSELTEAIVRAMTSCCANP
jgi:isocitrate dehydrogenase (NAD+)